MKSSPSLRRRYARNVLRRENVHLQKRFFHCLSERFARGYDEKIIMSLLKFVVFCENAKKIYKKVFF